MAEIASLLWQFVQCISPSVAERLKYHRNVYKNMANLKQRLDVLTCRKADMESKLYAELVEGETQLRSEVKNWLDHVEKIQNEVNEIEEKVKKAKFFSRSRLGKDVTEKIVEVEELHTSGEFPEGLVIILPRRGNEMPTTTQVGGETTFKRKMEEILESLLDDEVQRIGVFGMGGIGKTTALEHINNRLLKDHKDRFDNVIWVTVSKDCTLLKLQDKIAIKLDLDITKYDDKETRAEMLFAKLNTKKRYVLILDDLWDAYFLKEVGIPEPTRENKCKLIVTTRSLEICRVMSCKPIPVELLSHDEALKLFLDIVGCDILSIPGLEGIVKEIVQECAGLPLAIVTIAGSLKDVCGLYEWESALEELKESTYSKSGDRIFGRLKFSYDRLGDKKLQECLLYCSLYPEDHPIEREHLIERLMDEGIIEAKSRRSEIRKGQVMLNKLVNVCLLIDTLDDEDRKSVKMHDLVRDMALQITSDNPLFLVKAGVGLRSIPDEEDWRENLAKISLMYNNISHFPLNMCPPMCPILSTLFLSRNRSLSKIPASFFIHMRALSVLDLSDSGIEELPESISYLVNLTALVCRECDSLSKVPPLGELKNLKKLDFWDSGLEETPHGLENLVKLRYLNLSKTLIKVIPHGIISKLVNLQYLSLPGLSVTTEVRAQELEKLSKLENFGGMLYNIDNFITCVQLLEQRRLVSYVLQLGAYDILSSPDGSKKIVYIRGLDMGKSQVECGSKFPLLVPKDVESFHITSCEKATTICDLISFNNLTNLRSLQAAFCDDMQQLFVSSPEIFPILQRLENLSIDYISDLRWLIRSASSPTIPTITFSSLRTLEIFRCHKIKKLFTTVSLPNLEVLHLIVCDELEKIISTTYEDEDDKTSFVSLPKLRSLKLVCLPKLESIPVVADSLEYVQISDCSKLKELPFLDKEPFPISLRYVYIDWESCKSLECESMRGK